MHKSPPGAQQRVYGRFLRILVSHAGVFRGACFSSHPKKETPGWEAVRIPDDLIQEPVPRSRRWFFALAVNKSPAVFIFYHARLTEFEEKVEGL